MSPLSFALSTLLLLPAIATLQSTSAASLNTTLTRSTLPRIAREQARSDAKRAANGNDKRQYSVNVGFPYGTEKIRGVNIGGWLVLEPWITPDLFASLPDTVVDEYTFCAQQDFATASAALQTHWSTFYTEDDFRQIAAAGLNHVRIPVGHWSYESQGQYGDPYVTGAAEFVDLAIGWARTYGLKVMLDLHGAPGSQNGFDNSGIRGNANWATQSDYYTRTTAVIQALANKYSDPQYYGVVTALELLNEPAGYLNSGLLDTYTAFAQYDGFYTARYPFATQDSDNQSGLLIVFHDAFQAPGYWNGKFNYPAQADYMIDTHIYQVFSQSGVEQSWPQHLAAACDGSAVAASAAAAWPVVGEWSNAAYDCAFWLNGRGIGARYDGSYPGSTAVGVCSPFTGDGSTFSNEYKTFLGQFWSAQVQTYEANGQGWIMWAWKTPNAAEWSYQAGLAGGWIPSDPTQHVYTC